MFIKCMVLLLGVLFSLSTFSQTDLKSSTLTIDNTQQYEVNLDSLVEKLEADNIVVVEETPEEKLQARIEELRAKSTKAITPQNEFMLNSFLGGRCENVCSVSTCSDYCIVDLAPGEPDIRTCQQYYQSFFGSNRNIWITTFGQQICQLDDDVDIFSLEVDIEFFVSDHRVRKCNSNIISNRKREVAEVSCSFFTGLFNQSKCARRIGNKFAELAAAGIAPHPNLPDGDPLEDVCP